MNQIDLTQEQILLYQTDFICTYKLMDEEFTDDLYQIQILQAFNLERWYDNIINNLCFELYTLVTKSDTIFRDIIEKAKKMGADAYLIKPCFVEDVIEVIEKLLSASAKPYLSLVVPENVPALPGEEDILFIKGA